LSAIHYLTELNCSKKRILDNAPEHIITGPGNAWYTMRRAGYSVPVTRFVCWSAFRMHYVEGTSGSKTAIAGKSPQKLLQGKNGRLSGSPFAGRWDIPLMDIKACNSWRSTR
jgi:hypothetical protein